MSDEGAYSISSVQSAPRLRYKIFVVSFTFFPFHPVSSTLKWKKLSSSFTSFFQVSCFLWKKPNPGNNYKNILLMKLNLTFILLECSTAGTLIPTLNTTTSASS